MPISASPFDLCLAYPQWQGSGRHRHLPRGAAAAAAVCSRYAPLVQLPAVTTISDRADGIERWDAIFEQFRVAQTTLTDHAPRRVLTAGGDCAVDVAVIDYLHGVHRDLSVIWIDAHLDANTPETSPSGHFHGMPVSAILGRAPERMRPHLKFPIDPSRFRYVGIQVGDEGDWALQRELNLRTLKATESVRGPVHIHFDLDVLDPNEFPYLAYTDGTLAVDDAIALVQRIAREADVVGLTVTEFAPADETAVHEGSKVIERLCEAAIRTGRA